MGSGLSKRTTRLVERMFGADQRDTVCHALANDCGTNLPFCDGRDAVALERIRFAVLKLSDGDVEKLRAGVNLAKTDWRDPLVAAGFGDSLTEHDCWADSLLKAKAESPKPKA